MLARMRQIGHLISKLQMDITKMATAATAMAVDDTELEKSKEELDDEDLIRYYFYKNFQYKEICMSLQRKHGRQMSLRTLFSSTWRLDTL